MTAAGAASGGRAEGLAEAHGRLRADRAVQFDFPAAEVRPEPEPPAWLKALLDALEWAAPAFKYLFWIGLAAAVAGVLFFIGRELIRTRLSRREKPLDLAGEDWRPARDEALVLLADADALAAQGRFAEAAHLLLRRSVQDIRKSRPGLVKPALTSRDIAGHSGLPGPARTAFAAIARVVERSRFGGRAADAGGWTEARAAYTDFALPGALA